MTARILQIIVGLAGLCALVLGPVHLDRKP